MLMLLNFLTKKGYSIENGINKVEKQIKRTNKVEVIFFGYKNRILPHNYLLFV